LAYAGLARIDSADAYRLYLAEVLLDRGMPPRALMKELGIDATWLNLNKFDPDQPRDAHGRWTDESAADNRIVVAAQDKKPDHEDLNERAYEQRRLLGLTAPEEDAEHGHPHSLPEPLTAPAEVPKNVLPGLNGKPGNKGKFFSDLPGGLDEAQKLFDALTRGQTVTIEITQRGTTITSTPDRTQLRVNADGSDHGNYSFRREAKVRHGDGL